jgi:formyl-CoA transferase
MERADLMTDERSATNKARLAHVDFVEQQIRAWTMQLTRAEIMKKLNGDIPAGPVQDMSDIYTDPHTIAREMLETCDPGGDNPNITLAASPIKFSETPTNLYQTPPKLGMHNAEVLAEFGIEIPGGEDGK